MTVAGLVAAGVSLIGGTGYALAVNDLARWVVLIAAVAAVITAWTEARHIAATKRQITQLGAAPHPRRPADDNPQFYTGS